MESGPTLRRILAIDDDPISLAITAVLLESEGCAVLQASSGESALEMLAGQGDPPDCVVADLLMPSLCGPELAARLRPILPHARLVAMSATPPASVEGYDVVLRKPLSLDALRSALDALEPRPGDHAAPVSETPPTAPASDVPVLDTAVFGALQRAMSAAGLGEVVSTFLEDAATRLHAMRGADPATIVRQAHTIKGGASMLGVVQVAAVASVLESGVDHHGDRQRKLDELEQCLRRAEVMLKQRLRI